jgi:hypothetical protein
MYCESQVKTDLAVKELALLLEKLTREGVSASFMSPIQTRKAFCYYCIRVDRKTVEGLSTSPEEENQMTKKTNFPPGWDELRVKRVLEHYEAQSRSEALAEDEAAHEDPDQTFMEVPNELMGTVRELIAKKTEQGDILNI